MAVISAVWGAESPGRGWISHSGGLANGCWRAMPGLATRRWSSGRVPSRTVDAACHAMWPALEARPSATAGRRVCRRHVEAPGWGGGVSSGSIASSTTRATLRRHRVVAEESGGGESYTRCRDTKAAVGRLPPGSRRPVRGSPPPEMVVDDDGLARDLEAEGSFVETPAPRASATAAAAPCQPGAPATSSLPTIRGGPDRWFPLAIPVDRDAPGTGCRRSGRYLHLRRLVAIFEPPWFGSRGPAPVSIHRMSRYRIRPSGVGRPLRRGHSPPLDGSHAGGERPSVGGWAARASVEMAFDGGGDGPPFDVFGRSRVSPRPEPLERPVATPRCPRSTAFGRGPVYRASRPPMPSTDAGGRPRQLRRRSPTSAALGLRAPRRRRSPFADRGRILYRGI